MEITQFVATKREALLIGDSNAYRAQLSRQLLASRKRLGRATPKREKFAKKAVTAEDIGSNHAFVQLLLLTSERAWAHAMHIKNTHTEDAGGITGPTRSHIISRLAKAAKIAQDLVGLLKDISASKASEQDILEARAYHASLAGQEEFEKQSSGQRPKESQGDAQRWTPCLQHFSEARVIYAALLEKEKKEVYREILASTIDPSIRYAAYQAQLSRTIAISDVAKRYFPKADQELVKAVENLDRYALKDKPVVAKAGEEKQSTTQQIPDSVNWRGRKANIVDAAIGQALATVAAAEARLQSYWTEHPNAPSREKAAAYDEVLAAAQDAADATKSAIDELEKERVDEGDSRMQDLRVTSLSVNYDLVSWRIGRNRALIGEQDGMTFETQRSKKPKRPRKDGKEIPEKEEPRGRKLARLRERVVLYDATIQSINAIKELRGAMRDATFVQELDAKLNYFRALKCLNISYSHSLLGNHLNALALLKRAQDIVPQTQSRFPGSAATDSPLKLDISKEAEQLRPHLVFLCSRMHALVEMRTLESNSAIAAKKHMTSAEPIVQRLNDYPTPGTQVDLKNLVTYPPKIEPVPVKPLFLDVAFNYIEYPGRKVDEVVKTAQQAPAVNGVSEQPQQPQKKGWFSFGR